MTLNKLERPLSSQPMPASAKESTNDRPLFLWPNPPHPSYPPASAQKSLQPLEIVGLNDKRANGQLIRFVPEEATLHVQLSLGSNALRLRFDQFRLLTLTNPLEPLLPPAPGELRAQEFTVLLSNGGELKGETVGYIEDTFGLFLFVPVDMASGRVMRKFVPRAAFDAFELGGAAAPGKPEGVKPPPPQIRRDAVRATSPEQLLEAIDRQARMPMMRIGEVLTSLGMVDEAQLRAALVQQGGDRSVPLGEVLVRMGVVTRADLHAALARKMGLPAVDLGVFPVEADALRKISYSVAQRLGVMPLMIRDGRLIVAMDDPASRRAALAELEFNAQMKVFAVQSHARDQDAVLHAAYDKIGATSDRRPVADDPMRPLDYQPVDTSDLIETLEKEGRQPDDEEAPIEQSDNSLVRMINRMILEAHKEGVSDIHIESYPGREKIRIRFRKDGRLRTYLDLPPNYRNAMIARIKIMCDLDISEKRRPQDGKINFAKFSPEHRIELRVATIPTNNGLEDVVMRILTSAKPIPLDALGLSPNNLAWLKHAIERPYGMVLCVGPTGSGKTTTLHSALSHINVPERKIWTAEDPIEITQSGLRQVQVNPRIDWTFAKALRAFLRADPDVIMVGEIRDEATAEMAVEASLTGHLVLSTLHTNSAPETVTRLLDMGMDPFNFADSLLAVLAQRLVRRLCAKCLTSRPATAEETLELLSDYMGVYGSEEKPGAREAVMADWVQRHGRNGALQVYSCSGCAHCEQTGFKGRVGLHELMVISKELRRLIQTGARAEALQGTALDQGMRTLRQDGIDKVLAGLTTIEEVRATSNA
ncbi:GspE/PulE family protein [Variovorax sp. RT4R15]|uniref:GspE/PulE family protein n=1 Tax=Variovorax sp. RT4R15 TaxID=3443737 RepID=UPI003F481293